MILIERKIEELLTSKEYDIFLRFCIGPAEIPNKKEEKQIEKVSSKIEAERVRVEKYRKNFHKRAERILKKYKLRTTNERKNRA